MQSAGIDSAGGSSLKRPRHPSERSIQNLHKRKQCPECGALYGSAKRGACSGQLESGAPCMHDFVVNPSARVAAEPPVTETLPEGKRPLKTVQSRFRRLVNEVWGLCYHCIVRVAYFLLPLAVRLGCPRSSHS